MRPGGFKSSVDMGGGILQKLCYEIIIQEIKIKILIESYVVNNITNILN